MVWDLNTKQFEIVIRTGREPDELQLAITFPLSDAQHAEGWLASLEFGISTLKETILADLT